MRMLKLNGRSGFLSKNSPLRCYRWSSFSGCSPDDGTLHDLRSNLNLMKRGRPSVYIMDQHVAEVIAKTVQKHRTNPDSPFLECNPGPGIMTQAFFNSGVKSIITVESQAEFLPYLEKLQSRVGEKRLCNFFWNPFTTFGRHNSAMAKYQEDEAELFKLMPAMDWDDDPAVTFFGIVPPKNAGRFLSYVRNGMGKKDSFYGLGRPEWFLFVSPKQFRSMVIRNYSVNFQFYKKMSTLYSVFFNVDCLLELHRTDFYPPFPAVKTFQEKSHSHQDINKDNIYLVRLIPKKNLSHEAVSLEDYPKFLAFLEQILQKRKTRLIPRMEQWFPDCGIHLIKMGFGMMHLVGETSPQQIVQIFKAMQKWPEYKESRMLEVLFERYSHLIEDGHQEEELEHTDDHYKQV